MYEVPIRVRLINIDAPEKKQAFGHWSANQLKALLAGQSVTVSYTQTDRYGRIIGRVFTTNGTDASRFMVQSGAAWVYERYNTDKSLNCSRKRRNKSVVYGLTVIRFHRGNGDINRTDARCLSNPSTTLNKFQAVSRF